MFRQVKSAEPAGGTGRKPSALTLSALDVFDDGVHDSLGDIDHVVPDPGAATLKLTLCDAFGSVLDFEQRGRTATTPTYAFNGQGKPAPMYDKHPHSPRRGDDSPTVRTVARQPRRRHADAGTATFALFNRT